MTPLSTVVHTNKTRNKRLTSIRNTTSSTSATHHSLERDETGRGLTENGNGFLGRQPSFQNLLDGDGLTSTAALPDHIVQLYERLERENKCILSDADRRQFYLEFSQQESSSELLPREDVEFLIQERLGIDISDKKLKALIRQRLDKSIEFLQVSFEMNDLSFDFELFVSLLIDIRRDEKIVPASTASAMYGCKLKELFPLDPESKAKQVWDGGLLLLLLFCSFYFPYSVAFVTDEQGEGLRYVDVVIDAIFLVDVSLTFVTAYYDAQGNLIRHLPTIAAHYARTWLLPDLAGSFPFDQVVAAALPDTASGGAGGGSSGLGVMQVVRMVRLIRAVKFIGRLNAMKRQEGMEGYGTAMGIFHSLFTLVFTAHLLACFFTLLAVSESADDNWLTAYRADMSDEAAGVRYGVALYWAMVSVTTMGYGDVLPVTHKERIFTVVVAMIGAIVFSYCMANVSSLISQVKPP